MIKAETDLFAAFHFHAGFLHCFLHLLVANHLDGGAALFFREIASKPVHERKKLVVRGIREYNGAFCQAGEIAEGLGKSFCRVVDEDVEADHGIVAAAY